MGGFAFKLYGKGEHSGKTVQPCGDAFGGKIDIVNNPIDLFAWKVRSERKRRHLTQKKLAERLSMNSRTIIDLETGKSNPKFETVILLARELNISVDAAIFPEMVSATVSKTVIDFFAGKSEAEIQMYIALCKQAEAIQKDK